MRIPIIALATMCAGCSTPEELREPLRAPTMGDPVDPPDLSPYVVPSPHAVPRLDLAATPQSQDTDRITGRYRLPRPAPAAMSKAPG